VSGREGNLSAHKEDLKTLYNAYEKALKTTLTPSQIEKITSFLS
jgi:hypothetical protein